MTLNVLLQTFLRLYDAESSVRSIYPQRLRHRSGCYALQSVKAQDVTVLKPLEDAIQKEDYIHAVMQWSGIRAEIWMARPAVQ